MLRKILFLLILLVYCTSLHAQFELAFETPQPGRTVVLAKLRNELSKGKNGEQQTALYRQLESLSSKKNDKAAMLFAETCLAGVLAESEKEDVNTYVEKMQGIIQRAQVMQNDVLLIHVLMNFVDHLRERRIKGASISYFLLANELADKLPNEQIPRGAFGLKFDLMYELYQVGEYQQANTISYTVQNMPKEPPYELFCYDLKSQIMLHLNRYDSSAFFIHLAQSTLEADTTVSNHNSWKGILQGNLAKILFYQKQYRQAIPLFNEAIMLTNEAGLFDNTAPFSIFLAKCYLQLGEAGNIASLMPVMRNAIDKSGTEQDKADLYKILLATQAKELSPARILQLLDSAEIHQQLLALELDKNRLIQNEIKLVQQTYRQRQALLESNIQKQLLMRNLLWAFLGLVIAVAIWVIYRKNKAYRQERQVSDKRQQEIEQDLAYARNQLADFTHSLLEKTRQIALLETSADTDERTEVLESLRRNNILTEQDWTNFKMLFEKAYPGFLGSAQVKFPLLTAGELRFLSFIKLSFTNKEMAATLGVSAVSVRSIKSRLLKKLQLPENENLDLLVKKI